MTDKPQLKNMELDFEKYDSEPTAPMRLSRELLMATTEEIEKHKKKTWELYIRAQGLPGLNDQDDIIPDGLRDALMPLWLEFLSYHRDWTTILLTHRISWCDSEVSLMIAKRTIHTAQILTSQKTRIDLLDESLAIKT